MGVLLTLVLPVLAVPPAVSAPAHNDTATTTPEPDHGVDAETLDRLWAGSHGNSSGTETLPDSDLTDVVDHVFTVPPAAAKQWTAGEHREFPVTDADTAVVPVAATPTDRAWVRDAHLTIFAIQPSTVAHTSANTTRHYVRPEGNILAVADYRVEPPPDRTGTSVSSQPVQNETDLDRPPRRWELTSHEVREVELRADSTRIAATNGSHRPRLSFESLPENTDRLTLQAEIAVTLEQTRERQSRSDERVCESSTIENSTVRACHVTATTHRDTETRSVTQTVTVQDSVPVSVYELDPTVTRMGFADGDIGLTIDPGDGDPWARATLPGYGAVHSPWHFYSAPRDGWTSVEVRSADGTAREEGPAVPLQVHAFPSTGGAYADADVPGRVDVTTRGEQRAAPTLPENITVPVVTDSYRADAVTVRSGADLPHADAVVVHGLVRGADQTPTAVETREQRTADLTLTIEAVNRSAGTAQVRVELRDADFDEPIDLTDRPGEITVRNATLTPGADGTATATVTLGSGVLTAHYEPGPWHATDPAYTSATATAGVPTEWPDPIEVLLAGSYILLILTPLLLGIYLIDGLLGRGRLWPPWRGLE